MAPSIYTSIYTSIHKILAGCGGSVSLLVRPMFTLLYLHKAGGGEGEGGQGETEGDGGKGLQTDEAVREGRRG